MSSIVNIFKASKEALANKLSKLRPIKPALKGMILVVMGILLTRYELGVGFITINTLFGMFSYFLIAVSGLMLIRNIHRKRDQNLEILNLRRDIILFIILFILGFNLLLVYCFLYYFNLIILIFTAFIGIFWVLLWFNAEKERENNYILNIFNSLIFALGLFFGALLNTYLTPLYIYYFFISLLFLQLAREISKDLMEEIDIREKGLKIKSPKELKNIILRHDDTLGSKSKMIFLFGLTSLVFILLPLISTIANPIMYLYPLALTAILILAILYLSFKGYKENTFYPRINTLLKYAILLEIVCFLFAS